MSGNVLDKRLVPLLKYPGGKESELKYILRCLPPSINRYFEPFVGGGAVYFSIKAGKYYINDKSVELMSLYSAVKNEDIKFLKNLQAINYNWKIISLVVDNHVDELINIYSSYKNSQLTEIQLADEITQFVLANAEEFNGLFKRDFNYAIELFILELIKSIKNKMVRMKKISEKSGDLSDSDILANIESSLKSAFYCHLRYISNNKDEYEIDEGFSTAIYFFIRQTCYSSMFRYNKKGEFNVPYGGISYNRQNFDKKIEYFSSEELLEHLNKTQLGNMDFYDFMNDNEVQPDDFIFIDPPYDTEFSTYAKNIFDIEDQRRLAKYLISECRANFMIVIKNSELISELYTAGTKTANGMKLYVNSFDKKYFVSFQDRNNKEAKHLLITNYDIEWEDE